MPRFNQILMLTLLIAIWLPSNLLAQESDKEFQVIKVKNAMANELASVVHELAGNDQPLRIAVDVRTNSLVVSGSPDNIELIKTLVEKLDVPPQRTGETESYFKTYQFRDPQTLEQSVNLLQSMFQGQKGVKLGSDSNALQFYLQGNQSNHDFAQMLLGEIQQAESTKAIGNVHVVTMLVLDGNQISPTKFNLKEPDEYVGGIFEKAKKKGLLNFLQPMIASRVTSLTRPGMVGQPGQAGGRSPGGRFGNQSKGNLFSLGNTGFLTRLTENKFKLESTVEIGMKNTGSSQASTEFHSVIELPLEHPVLLSCSTIGDIDAVIVVMIADE